MTKIKDAQVRYYIDADLLGLANVLIKVRDDVTYPGDPGGVLHKRERPPCPITTPATKDHIWIPEVTRHGWLIITRDKKIQEHRAEIAAVCDYGARMIALTGPGAAGTFNQLEIVMCRWRDIEKKLDETGPFIYTVTRTTISAIPLN